MKWFFILGMLSLFSCGTYESTTQQNQSSFLQIVGAVDGEELFLDDSKMPIVLGKDTQSFKQNNKIITKFKVTKGKHLLRIIRNGSVVLMRNFYVSSGNVYELEMP